MSTSEAATGRVAVLSTSEAACFMEWCSTWSTRHRGQAAGRSVFLLDGQSAYCILMCSLLDDSVE